MYLIAGLGNPGSKYELTRHNAGFWAIDNIVKSYKLNPGKQEFNSETYKGLINSQKVIAVKPLTFMNNSGQAIGQFAKFYKIPSENIIIIHDELDLHTGDVKTKIGGGNAGHNGLKSIDSYIGKDYHRIRIGIDHPRNINSKMEVSDYVLAKVIGQDMDLIAEAVVEAVEIVGKIIKNP